MKSTCCGKRSAMCFISLDSMESKPAIFLKMKYFLQGLFCGELYITFTIVVIINSEEQKIVGIVAISEQCDFFSFY